MIFWGKINQQMQRYGHLHLKNRYLLVKFEDLCHCPKIWTQKILHFAGCSQNRLEKSVKLIKKPKSIGRWKTYDQQQIEAVWRCGKEYLEWFGYV